MPRISRRTALLVFALGGVSATLATCSEPPGSANDVDPISADVAGGGERAAPEFVLDVYQGADLLGGQQVAFREVLNLGQPVVLNFWAGQCPPCRLEMPEFERVYQQVRDRVVLIGLDVGPFVGLGSHDEGRALAKEIGVTYPLATTDDLSIMAQLSIVAMPSTLFITPRAEIVRHWTGVMTGESLAENITELLAASEAS